MTLQSSTMNTTRSSCLHYQLWRMPLLDDDSMVKFTFYKWPQIMRIGDSISWGYVFWWSMRIGLQVYPRLVTMRIGLLGDPKQYMMSTVWPLLAGKWAWPPRAPLMAGVLQIVGRRGWPFGPTDSSVLIRNHHPRDTVSTINAPS